MLDQPSPLSSDYILDFQSTDFDADSKIVLALFSEWAEKYFPDKDEKEREAMFGLSEPEHPAGWHFANLYLSSGFVRTVHDMNSYEFELINPFQKPAVNGKVYIGNPFVMMLVVWLNAKLKEKGCKAEVKVGPEMADVALGTPGSASGGFVAGGF